MMKYNPDIHRRRSLRLKGYDYSRSGAYFVTICTTGRECLFGEVVDGEMRLNEYGRIVFDEWFRSSQIRTEIALQPDEFVVMPNHIHGIVWLVGAHGDENVGVHGCAPLHRPPRSLGAFIAGFKSAVTKHINELRSTPGVPVWQRNYYEHIIRNEQSLNQIRTYITNNPLRWHLDRENPGAVGEDTELELWAKQ